MRVCREWLTVRVCTAVSRNYVGQRRTYRVETDVRPTKKRRQPGENEKRKPVDFGNEKYMPAQYMPPRSSYLVVFLRY